MAIAFNSATNSFGTGTGLTFAHTVAGSNTLLLVFVGGDNTLITGVTYAGASMTNMGSQTSAGETGYIFGLLAPTTGANNVVISASGSQDIQGCATSYTGVKQSGLPDASNYTIASNTTGGASPFQGTGSVTTVADNSWAWIALRGQLDGPPGHATPWVSGTIRNSGTSYFGVADSNAALTPAGSKTITGQWTRDQDYFGLMISFAPVAVASGNSKFFAFL